MEKRNIIESGRTPAGEEKQAEVIDSGVNAFEKSAKTEPRPQAEPKKETKDVK